MGRLFVKHLEEPVYRCKKCQVELAVYDPKNQYISLVSYSTNLGKLYIFLKCFNVVIGTDKVSITLYGNVNCSTYNKVYCIACDTLLGYYNKGPVDTVMYNEGRFYINRLKLLGPPGGSDDDDDDDDE